MLFRTFNHSWPAFNASYNTSLFILGKKFCLALKLQQYLVIDIEFHVAFFEYLCNLVSRWPNYFSRSSVSFTEGRPTAVTLTLIEIKRTFLTSVRVVVRSRHIVQTLLKRRVFFKKGR
jgi:hypothetical protein